MYDPVNSNLIAICVEPNLLWHSILQLTV